MKTAKTLTVTIRETRAHDPRTWTHTARTTDHTTALERAIRRHFPRGAWFWADSGIRVDGEVDTRFGTVCLPCRGGGSNVLTSMVRVEIA